MHYSLKPWLNRSGAVVHAIQQNPLAILVGSSAELMTGLVYPPECVVCEAETPLGARLCATCEGHLVSMKYCCQRCSMPLPDVIPNNDCIHCRKAHWKFSRVVALGAYRGKLREAVILCKQFPNDALRHALGLHLVDRVRHWIPLIDEQQPIIIPIPYHWSRSLTRRVPTAFNLADVMSRASGWPMVASLVRRTRPTRKQSMLSAHERIKNVRGAFKRVGSQSLEGRHVLLVDDVLTSGATADEVARQLKLAKPADITMVVIARATGS